MGNELTVYDRISDPIVYAEKMGAALAKSGMCGLPNEEAGMIIAMTCLCDGITPMDYMRRYHTINGKPSMRSDAMLAEFRINHGGNHKVVERSPDRSTIRLISRDESIDEFSLTWDEAQEAGWPYYVDKKGEVATKDTWDSRRGRQTMLWARVVSDAIRTVCPEVNAGVYTPEEMADIPPAGIQDPKQQETVITVEADQAEPVTKETDPAAERESVAPEPLQSTTKQHIEITSYFNELSLTESERQAVIIKRGCSDLDYFTRTQAAELLDKLSARARKQRGN